MKKHAKPCFLIKNKEMESRTSKIFKKNQKISKYFKNFRMFFQKFKSFFQKLSKGFKRIRNIFSCFAAVESAVIFVSTR